MHDVFSDDVFSNDCQACASPIKFNSSMKKELDMNCEESCLIRFNSYRPPSIEMLCEF